MEPLPENRATVNRATENRATENRAAATTSNSSARGHNDDEEEGFADFAERQNQQLLY